MDIFRKVSNWYFSKRVLPYWAILLNDTVLIFASALFVYWIADGTQALFDNRHQVVATAVMVSALSWAGARVFRTYSGVLRYSSFVDLLKLTYANLVTLALAVGSYFLFDYLGMTIFCAMTPLMLLASLIVATALMWGLRIMVKIMFDISNTDAHMTRVLIYGALVSVAAGRCFLGQMKKQ